MGDLLTLLSAKQSQYLPTEFSPGGRAFASPEIAIPQVERPSAGASALAAGLAPYTHDSNKENNALLDTSGRMVHTDLESEIPRCCRPIAQLNSPFGSSTVASSTCSTPNASCGGMKRASLPSDVDYARLGSNSPFFTGDHTVQAVAKLCVAKTQTGTKQDGRSCPIPGGRE